MRARLGQCVPQHGVAAGDGLHPHPPELVGGALDIGVGQQPRVVGVDQHRRAEHVLEAALRRRPSARTRPAPPPGCSGSGADRPRRRPGARPSPPRAGPAACARAPPALAGRRSPRPRSSIHRPAAPTGSRRPARSCDGHSGGSSSVSEVIRSCLREAYAMAIRAPNPSPDQPRLVDVTGVQHLVQVVEVLLHRVRPRPRRAAVAAQVVRDHMPSRLEHPRHPLEPASVPAQIVQAGDGRQLLVTEAEDAKGRHDRRV